MDNNDKRISELEEAMLLMADGALGIRGASITDQIKRHRLQQLLDGIKLRRDYPEAGQACAASH